MLKRILKMLGSIALYIIAYLSTQFIAGIFIDIIGEIRAGVIFKNKIHTTGGSVSNEYINYVSNFVQNTFRQDENLIYILCAVLSILFFTLLLADKKKNIFKYSGFRKIKGRYILIAIVIGMGFNFLIGYIFSVVPIDKLFPDYKNVIDKITGGGQNYIVVLITTSLIAPLFEETLNRGIIFGRLMEDSNIVIAVILQALVFGTMHMNWLQGIYAFCLGIILAIVYLWTNSIWGSIFVHMAFNSSNYIFNVLKLPGYVYGIAGLLMCTISMIILYTNRKNSMLNICNNI